MSAAAPVFNRCRHLFVEGRQCGSRSLRNENFCYYHHTTRIPAPNVRSVNTFDWDHAFELAMPDSYASIQYGIGEVLRRLAAQQIKPKTASLMLYGLSLASANLVRTVRFPVVAEPASESEPVTEVVIDPDEGLMAPTGEPLLPKQILIAPGRLRRQRQVEVAARHLANMHEVERRQREEGLNLKALKELYDDPTATWRTNLACEPPVSPHSLDYAPGDHV